MNEGGKPLRWQDLRKGLRVSVPFCIDESKMRTFIALSGDNSRIHRDAAFARRNGFQDRVVYGALQVAELSYLVGMHLPGDFGLATGWQINFHKPLYIGDQAVMNAELVHLSEATRTITLKFSVNVAERLVATGTAHSMLLHEENSGD